MELYHRTQSSRTTGRTGGRTTGAYRFDPWQAEIATMDHAAANMADLINGLGRLLRAAVRGIGVAIQTLRSATPVEVEPVQIARPANVSEQTAANRAAA